MVDGSGGRPSIRRAAVPLDGRRVHLRPAAPADADTFAAILSDPTVHPWWQAADPAADARQLADRTDDVAVWAIEEAGLVVGMIQAHEETDPRYRHAGIDIVLAGPAQDRGLGSDAVRTVARWLIEERGHHRLTIDPAASNERAIRAYGRVGFRPVGLMRRYEGDLDGTWHDGLLMDLLADELNDHPTQPDASNGDLVGSVTLMADEDEAYLSTGAVWLAEPSSNQPQPASVTLSADLVQALIDHARTEDPNEACGLIIGDRPAADGGAALRFEAVRNRAASPHRYEIHPDDLLRLTIATDDADEVFWAIVHSHVRSPAYPSPTDVGLAFYPDALYVLVSLAEDEPALGAFRIVDGAIHRVEILVGE